MEKNMHIASGNTAAKVLTSVELVRRGTTPTHRELRDMLLPRNGGGERSARFMVQSGLLTASQERWLSGDMFTLEDYHALVRELKGDSVDVIADTMPQREKFPRYYQDRVENGTPEYTEGTKLIAHINATKNNCVISYTLGDEHLFVATKGTFPKSLLKGRSLKMTPLLMETRVGWSGVQVRYLLEWKVGVDVDWIHVRLKGYAYTRNARRGLRKSFPIQSIKQVNTVPHGGCRPKKMRRI